MTGLQTPSPPRPGDEATTGPADTDPTAGVRQLGFFPDVDRPRAGHAGPNPPQHRNADPRTSTAAAGSSPGARAANRHRYLTVIASRGARGATRDEVADAVNAKGAEDRALSRRLTDLHQQGLTYDSGRTRAGHSGLQQIVWVAMPARAQ